MRFRPSCLPKLTTSQHFSATRTLSEKCILSPANTPSLQGFEQTHKGETSLMALSACYHISQMHRRSLPVPIPILKMVRVLCFPCPLHVSVWVKECQSTSSRGNLDWPFRLSRLFPALIIRKGASTIPPLMTIGARSASLQWGSTLNKKIR